MLNPLLSASGFTLNILTLKPLTFWTEVFFNFDNFFVLLLRFYTIQEMLHYVTDAPEGPL